MGIEEQFSDAKGVRFGLKLKWTQFTKAEFVERMYLLVGVALLLWTSVGRAVEQAQPNVRLESKTKGGAPLFSAYRLILLAEYGQAVEVDDSFCPRALAAATPENVQMVDGRSKVISGQAK